MTKPFRFRPMAEVGLPWQRIMSELTERPGISGALLVTRDGLCVINRCHGLQRAETVSALAAAVLAASETMAAELNGGAGILFKIETPRLRVVGVGASEELLVLAVADVSTNAEEVFRHLQSVVGRAPSTPG